MNYTNIIKNDVKMYAVFEDFKDDTETVKEYIKAPVLYIGITDDGSIAPLIADDFAGFECPEIASNFLGYEFPTIEYVYSDCE